MKMVGALKCLRKRNPPPSLWRRQMKNNMVPNKKDMGSLGMRKGGKVVKKYAAGGAIKPAPIKDDSTPTAKEKAEMKTVRDEGRRDKAENDAYNKASGMKFAKGGPISGDKDMKAIDKTVEANKLKDYMVSESAAKAKREVVGVKKFARGGGIEKKGKTRGKFI